MTGVLTDRHWQVLANLIGHPELSTDPAWATSAKRVADRDEANALLQRYLVTRTKAETLAEFLTARLPVSAVRTYAEAAADPHVKERGMLEEIELEDGSIAPIVGPAAKFSRTPARIQAAAPMLGRDNVAILKELGFDEDAMAALRTEGVIGDYD
jgi:formyl-CoA transferase